MKRLFLSLLCTVVASTLFAQKPFKVEINSTGSFEPAMAYIYMSGDDVNSPNEVTDSVAFKKGKAKWETKLDGVRIARIRVKASDGKLNARLISFYAVPDEKLQLTVGDKGSAVFAGSKFYQQANPAIQLCFEQSAKLMEFGNKANQQLREAPEAEREALQTKLMTEYEALLNNSTKAFADYVSQHNTEEGVVSMLLCVNDPEPLATVMSDDLKNGRMGTAITGLIKKIADAKAAREARRKAVEEAKKKVYEGAVAPDFTLNDINGQPLSLSSLRGKYVILDWWGSWCGWCIKGMPQMKEYYAKYKDKLEILGIDCNDTESKWKAAVEKHELPWLHVYNPSNSTLAADYAIEGFPTKFVIDPEGKITKIIVGESPDFYTYLDELFK